MDNNSESNNKRIAKNTIMLYIRMLFTMGVSLYTSRVVLATLGVADYGIYNVVGGIVVVLSFLNVSMAGAVQRFLNVELGRNDNKALEDVFQTSRVIHIVIAGIILLLGETVGVWFLNTCMNIESSRMLAANYVFQSALFSFIFTVISVPYNAEIIAHERMTAFAYISVIEAISKLAIVYLLLIIPFDKLIVYSILTTCLSVSICCIYIKYCMNHFEECKSFKLSLNKDISKRIVGFSSWTVFGSLGTISHTQGISIIINMFFGVTVNAAQGIANQVTSIVNQFVYNFMTALNPQIVKTYAAGDYDTMHVLVMRGSRMGICLVSLFAVPLFFEVPLLLDIWLKEVPEYTTTFIRVILLTSLSLAYAIPLSTSRSATGDIKMYQIVLTSMAWMHLPLAWLFYYWGFAPQSSMYIYLIIVNVEQIYRIFNVCPAIKLPISTYVSNVLGRSVLMLVVSFVPSYILYYMLSDTIANGILVLIFSFFTVAISSCFIVLDSTERRFIIEIVKKKIRK